MKRFALAAFALLLAAGAAVAATKPFPEKIALPNGFQPEGIAIAPGGTFYVGSIPTGDIYRGNLRTGRGSLLVDVDGRSAIGVEFERGRLFVAGGSTGRGFVYNARTGAEIANLQLATGAGDTFVNDVVVTKDAAWFTDSNRAVLYKVPIANNGALGTPVAVPLTGDFQLQPGFNTNGIDATPNGQRLVIVQSNTGKVFTVDPATGTARTIDVPGYSFSSGDGVLLLGKTLYVVVRREQNRVAAVAVVQLAADFASGRFVRELTDPDFDVPTTIDDFGARLYAVNARFGTAPGPTTEYHVVQFRRR